MYKRPGKWKRAWLRMKWPLLDSLHKTGLGKRLLRMRDGARIVTWHGIDLEGSTRYNTRFTSQADFEKQILWMKQNCQLLTLSEFWKGRFAPGKLNLCLTFDDGLENNFTLALPVLKKHGVPATFFVTGIRSLGYDILWPDLLDLCTPLIRQRISIGGRDWIPGRNGKLADAATGELLMSAGRTAPWPFVQELVEALLPHAAFRWEERTAVYWRVMKEDQIASLAAEPGMEVGSHGLSHAVLRYQSAAQSGEELSGSKNYLERITGREVVSFAYPDANYSRENVEAAQAAGYRYQLASVFHHAADATDERLRERFGFNPFISWENQQYALLRGRY